MNKNISRIVSSSLLLQVCVAISGFILPKFFIETYGSEVNGLINSIKQFLLYFSTISLGLASATSVALYKPLYENDTKQVNRILSATRIFFNKTGLMFLGIVVVFSIVYSFLIESDLGAINIFFVVLVLGIGAFCEYILVSKYRILLISDQKNYIVSRITTEGVIINLVVSIVLILNNTNYIIVQIVATAIYIFRLLSTKSYVYKQYPGVDFYSAPDFTAIEGRWDAFFYEIPKLVINYSPVIIITIFMNLTWVSIYSVYNMVYSSLFMIISVFTTGINAIFGNLLVQKSKYLREKFELFVFVFNIISLVLYCSSFILILPFIKLYISSDVNYIYPTIAFGFTISGYFRSMRLPYNVIIEAGGKFKENKIPNILEAIAFLLLSFISMNVLGVYGILLSSAVTGFIRNVVYVVYVSKKITKQDLKQSLLIYFLNTALLFIVPSFISNFINFSNITIVSWIYKAFSVVTLTTIIVLVIESLTNLKNVGRIVIRIKNKF